MKPTKTHTEIIEMDSNHGKPNFGKPKQFRGNREYLAVTNYKAVLAAFNNPVKTTWSKTPIAY